MIQASPRKELALAMAVGAATGRVTMSRLMSPKDLERVSREQPELKKRLRGSWCLCTEVPAAMWRPAVVAYTEGASNHVVVAQAESGRQYIVIAVNALGWQHRVCVPMLGVLTAQWLHSLRETGTMTMSIGDAGSDQTFLTTSDVPLAAIEHLTKCESGPPSDLVAFLEEAFTLVAWNMVNNPFTCNEATASKELSVSLVLPAEVEALLEQRSERFAGRKPN